MMADQKEIITRSLVLARMPDDAAMKKAYRTISQEISSGYKPGR